MRAPIVLSLLAALLVLAVLAFEARRSTSPRQLDPKAEPPESRLAPATDGLAVGPTSSETPSDDIVSTVPTPSASLPEQGLEAGHARLEADTTSWVLDGAGRPIPAAEVSWVAPEADWVGLPGIERLEHPGPFRGLRATTDANGQFRFDSQLETGDHQESVIWVTRDGYEAAFFSIAAGEARAGRERFVLDERGGIEVWITDRGGKPVAGARVATTLADDSTHPEGAALTAIEKAGLVRAATSDANGRCRLPALLGEQYIVAHDGLRRSTVWSGRAPASLRLVLADTFELSGRVRTADPQLRVDQMRVTASAVEGGVRRILGRVRCLPVGSFGPLELAAVRGDELVIRLEGSGAVPVEVRRSMPAPGEIVRVDFEPEGGLGLAVLVVDPEERRIPLACVEAWWREGVEWCSSRGRTSAEGRADLTGIRTGEIHLVVRAPRHAEYRTGSFEFDETKEGRFLIELVRTGCIVGKVLHAGEPVPSFRVLYWGAQERGVHSISVTDSTTGEFEVPSAPGQQVVIFASAPGLAPSALQTIEVPVGEITTLDLELTSPTRGRGRVLDSSSAEPIEGAHARPWMPYEREWKTPTGQVGISDHRGLFDLEGLVAGENYLEIRAPGYAPLWGTPLLEAGGDGDLGSFLMTKAQDVRVVLRAGEIAPELCRVGIVQRPGPVRFFSTQGEILFENVTPGNWTVWVELPDGIRIEEYVFLSSGQPWLVEVEVDGETGRGVEVIVKSQLPLPEGLQVRSGTGLGPSRLRERWVAIEGDRCRIPGPLGEEVTLELRDEFRRIISVHHANAEELRAGRVELAFEGQERILRIVDRDGVPLARTRVVLTVEGDRSQWRGWGDADQDGRIALIVPPRKSLLLHLMLPDGGALADQPIDLESSVGSEHVVIVDVKGSFEVRFSDDGTPLQAVASSLLSPSGFRCAYLSFSDAEGRARIGSLASGSYLLDVPHPGVWPVQVPIDIGTTPLVIDVHLRRLGALTVEVRGPEGNPIAGARIELRSEEFGADVSDWITQARVPAPPGGLVTSGQGRVRVGGIPNGPYRYRISSPDGREAQGQLVVPPHAEGQVKVVLP